MVAAVLGDDLFHGGDGALDHAVVRLEHRQMLKGHARRGDEARQPVLMPAGQLDQLVARPTISGSVSSFTAMRSGM